MRYRLASSSWDSREIEAIQRVIESGRFTMGNETSAMESEFANYVGSKHCVMVNSGSSANLLMIAALRYRSRGQLLPGDEVIVPAVSWATTYTPLYQYGLIPVLADIDSRTLNLDLDQLPKALTANSRAVLAVNLLGNPNEFERLIAFCDEHELLLLEDNCEALGASYAGKQTGTYGLMGTFSSFFSHHMSTMEGGYLCTDDEELYQICLSLRAHGWTRDLPERNHVTGTKGPDPFQESYRFVLPGYNLRPIEMAAAVGREQLRKLSEFIRIRRANAEAFLEMMREFPEFVTQQEIGESSWFGFSLVLAEDAPWSRGEVLQVLARHGVETRPIVAGNFAKNDVLKLMPHRIVGPLSGADHVDERGMFVGNHEQDLTEEIGALREALHALPR